MGHTQGMELTIDRACRGRGERSRGEGRGAEGRGEEGSEGEREGEVEVEWSRGEEKGTI